MCSIKTNKIRLFVPAGAAAATPPFGPILGQYGVNTVQFCKDFNDATEALALFFTVSDSKGFQNFLLVVDIFINEDRTYKYVIHKPTVSFLLRVLCGVKTGAANTVVGVLQLKQLVFLAQFKFPHLELTDACKIIVGSARSIGIKILF